MYPATTFKAFTYFTCGRLIKQPKGARHGSEDDFISIMKAQIQFEQSKNDERSVKNIQILERYTTVLDLIKKSKGKFFRWRRDICLSVIIVEATFDDINDLKCYLHMSQFPAVRTRPVYSVSFDGTVSEIFSPQEYASLQKMWEKMYMLADKHGNDPIGEFYGSVADFLYEDVNSISTQKKIKTFKNRGTHLVVDVEFPNMNGFMSLLRIMNLHYAEEKAGV